MLVNQSDGSLLVCAKDWRECHPLHHSTIVSINLLGEPSISPERNLLNEDERGEKSGHLLSHSSIYLTREPCLMCSMALLHSRISTVYFLERNLQHGALASNYRLHRLKKTNHRFLVYQLEQEE